MAERKEMRAGDVGDRVKPDMTPLIDVCFLLITFFIMLLTIAKDEAAQRIELPLAPTAEILEDDQIPDSLNINVAYIDPKRPAGEETAGPDRKPMLLGWGLQLDLSGANRQAGGWATLRKLLRNEAAIQKQRQAEEGSDWKKDGLSTTLIFRLDQEVEYSIFREIMDICRSEGFSIFQLKARSEDEANG